MREFCARFSHAPPEAVRLGKRYFFDPRGLHAVAQAKHWDVFSVGIFLGEGTPFRPTPALLDMLDGPAVIVHDDAAWLVLCGKDVLMEGVRDAPDVPVGSSVLIKDADGHVLGYGDVKAEFSGRTKHKEYVKTRVHRGDYLHREKR